MLDLNADNFVAECIQIEFAGMTIRQEGLAYSGCHTKDRAADGDWRTDLEWARRWRSAATALTEELLESLPYPDPQRRDPERTTAMARAGGRSDARVRRRLARWVAGTDDRTAHLAAWHERLVFAHPWGQP